MTRTRSLIALASIAGALLAVAPARAATQQVAIAGVSFDPQDVTILPGDTVLWENQATVVHTVTDRTCPDAPCLFDQEINPGQLYSRTFDDPGIIRYRCRIHGFTGTITIADPPGALPDLNADDVAVEAAGAFGVPLPTTSRVEVALSNLGTASAIETPVRVEYRYRGRWHLIEELDLGPLGPGASATASVLWDTSHLVGDFVVRAVADPAGAIEELRESNNEASTTAGLLLPSGLAPGLDLLDPLG